MMDIYPILAPLRRHRLVVSIIALQIALACGVLCNACFLVFNCFEAIDVDSGVSEPLLATITISGYNSNEANDLNARVLAAIRAVPGATSASVVRGSPFNWSFSDFGVSLQPPGGNQPIVASPYFYLGSQDIVSTLGLRVVAGRSFQPDDFIDIKGYLPGSASVIVSRALADRLWPGEEPLGKIFYVDQSHYLVIGVAAHLVRPNPIAAQLDDAGLSVLIPATPGPQFAGSYLLRVNDPKQMDTTLKQSIDAIRKIAPNVVVDEETTDTLPALRAAYFKQTRALAGMLLCIIVGMLCITGLGIGGLTGYWVQKRRKHVGVRRALGATRTQILLHFQTENFLIVSMGIALGALFSYGINWYLMNHFEQQRLPLAFVAIASLALWTLGQVAIVSPSLRAARSTPIESYRSV